MKAGEVQSPNNQLNLILLHTHTRENILDDCSIALRRIRRKQHGNSNQIGRIESRNIVIDFELAPRWSLTGGFKKQSTQTRYLNLLFLRRDRTSSATHLLGDEIFRAPIVTKEIEGHGDIRRYMVKDI